MNVIIAPYGVRVTGGSPQPPAARRSLIGRMADIPALPGGLPFEPQSYGLQSYGPQSYGPQQAMAPARQAPMTPYGMRGMRGRPGPQGRIGRYVGADAMGSYCVDPAECADPFAENPACGRNRVFMLNFGGISVAANATTPFPVNPQMTFRGRKVVVPGSIAPAFAILITVGNQPQSADAGALPTPCEVFSNASQDVNIYMDTAFVGQTITVTATNLTAAAATFRCTIIGDSGAVMN